MYQSATRWPEHYVTSITSRDNGRSSDQSAQRLTPSRRQEASRGPAHRRHFVLPPDLSITSTNRLITMARRVGLAFGSLSGRSKTLLIHRFTSISVKLIAVCVVLSCLSQADDTSDSSARLKRPSITPPRVQLK